MELTFNEWAIDAPKMLNGHAEALLEDCINLARKYTKRGRSAELRKILGELGYDKVSNMEGKTADLKAFFRKVTALPKYPTI